MSMSPSVDVNWVLSGAQGKGGSQRYKFEIQMEFEVMRLDILGRVDNYKRVG